MAIRAVPHWCYKLVGRAFWVAGLLGIIGVIGVTIWPGYRQLGFTDRVLWRVPSPDAQVVAVCQERPEFDGPGYRVRLEHPDGKLVRPLYEIGDGDPCSEVVWSPDGSVLAILSAHVARVRFVDVKWALANTATDARYHARQVAFSTETQPARGNGLRLLSRDAFTLEVCPVSYKGPNRLECLDTPTTKRGTIPSLR